MRITLRPISDKVTRDELREFEPAICCDFYIEQIEKVGEPLPWGFRSGAIENVDHHAPELRFERHVSSANLAIERVRAVGIAAPGVAVVINHTDCDSLLSSAIVAGLLEPADRYGAAAIAADHTGEVNPIADLLQALDRLRDVELSLRALAALERGDGLPAEAAAALAVRMAKREEAIRAVADGRFTNKRGIHWGAFEHEIDGELFPALLPAAEIIVVGHPNPDFPDKLAIKTRLGLAAPAGMSLLGMGIKDFDEAWGGRWNGGSNKRGGGTSMSTPAWARELANRLVMSRSAVDG